MANSPCPSIPQMAFLELWHTISGNPGARESAAGEIADLVVSLGSDESRYMTGQCVTIDGGMTL